MEEMYLDKCGACAVLSAFKYITKSDIKVKLKIIDKFNSNISNG